MEGGAWLRRREREDRHLDCPVHHRSSLSEAVQTYVPESSSPTLSTLNTGPSSLCWPPGRLPSCDKTMRRGQECQDRCLHRRIDLLNQQSPHSLLARVASQQVLARRS